MILAAAREGRDLDREARERAKAREVEKQALAARLTVAGAVEQYLCDLADRDSPRTGRRPTPSTLRATRVWLARLREKHGDDFLANLGQEEIESLLKATPAKSRRNSYGALSRLWTWALRHGHVDSNIPIRIDRPAPLAPRTAMPSPAEVRRLLEAADRLCALGRWLPTQRDAVYLLALTGQRRAEVTTMDWRHIDLSRGLWTQPSTANKAKRMHVVPLTYRLLSLLQTRWEAAGKPTEGLVLPSVRAGGIMTANVSDLAETLRAETGIALRFHDLRRSLTTSCADVGVSFEVLDGVLNHAASQSRGGLRAVYNRAQLVDAMRQALTVWDSVVFDNVVPLRRPA